MDTLSKLELQYLAEDVNKLNTTEEKRRAVYDVATYIFNNRNAIYKDAWRDYRIGTFVDRNLVKAKRLRELDERGIKEEMIEQALDQVNELLFMVILLLEDIMKDNVESEG